MVTNDKKIIRKLVYKLLWVMDDFDRNLRAIQQHESLSNQQLHNLQYTRQQLKETLIEAGVEFDDNTRVGDIYNPHVHEVIEQRENADFEDNTIIEVFEIGCKWDDKRIRMSKVVVNNL